MQHHEESPEKSQYNMAILGEREGRERRERGERERERQRDRERDRERERKDSIKFCLKKVLEK